MADVILATRGWGREEFRLAAPDFMAAVRVYLFAEKMAPVLREQEAIQAAPTSRDMTPDSRLALASAKTDAAKIIAALKPILYPEDE